MRSSILTAVACLSSTAYAVTGALGDAPITTLNLPGIAFKAELPERNTTGVRGHITGTSNANGTGVVFDVKFWGFPDEVTNGPFIYHIHADPVPADGNCTKTLAHLDPFIRGEAPACDPTIPQTCQVGDLSGKHGNITTSPFLASYLELYTTTLEGPGAFFGNRSIVVHNQNKTRLNCANFTLVHTNYTGPNGSNSSYGPQPVPYLGGADYPMVSIGAVGAAVIGMMFLMI